MKEQTEVASLHKVEYDASTDDVLITFKVNDPKYKTLMLQLARRDDIELIFRGDKLDLMEIK